MLQYILFLSQLKVRDNNIFCQLYMQKYYNIYY